MYKKTFLLFSTVIAACVFSPVHQNIHAASNIQPTVLFPELSDSLDAEDDEFEVNETTDSEISFIPRFRSLLLSGSRFTYRHELAYRTGSPERLVSNRSSLRLQWERLIDSNYFVYFDGKISYDAIYDRRDYRPSVERNYRYRKQLREFYLQAAFEKISFKIGEQIIVWGEADGSVIMDVISPRDLTEFIYTPVEDARRGQLMLKLDYFGDEGQWTLILNPDPGVNIYPFPGHEYALAFPANPPGILVLAEDRPDWSISDFEVGLRWKKVVQSSDISVMAATLIDDNPVLRLKGTDAAGSLLIQPEYRRFGVAGAAANFSSSNILWKAEAGFKFNKSFNRDISGTTTAAGDGTLTRSTFDTALGLDYTASGAYFFSVEVANQHISGWKKDIQDARRNETIIYALWSKDFLNETLTLQYVYVHQVQDRDGFHRGQVSYDITDQLSCTFEASYFDAEETDSFFGLFHNQSRVYAEIKYYF